MNEESWFDVFERDDAAQRSAVRQTATSTKTERCRAEHRSRTNLQTLTLLVAMIGSAIVFLAPYTERMSARWRAWSSPTYAASPFFTIADFDTIELGMTESEVRTRIGFPLIRLCKLESGRRLWTYTAPKSKDPGTYRSCHVVFDGKPGRVRRIIQETCNNRTTWAESLRKPLVESLGGFVVTTADGRVVELSPGSKKCFVLVTEPDEFTELTSLVSDSVEVLLLPHSAAAWLNSGSVEYSTSMGVYRSGTLYRTAPRFQIPERESDQEDRRWLIRRLLMESAV